MIEEIYPLTFRRYRELPVFGSILDDYVKWAWDRGHTYYTIKAQLCACVRISGFMRGKGIKSWTDISHNAFDSAYRKFFEVNHSSVAGSTVRRLEEFLEENKGLPHRPPVALTRSETELKLFLEYLSRVKGFRPNTIDPYRIYLSQFLRFIQFEENKLALQHLNSAKIDDFIVKCSKTQNRYSLQHLVGYLRAFLRYEFNQGAMPFPLHKRIDSPRVYRLEKLPKALPWRTVKELLDSINRQTPQGCRNYAIMQLICTYGLRSGEVVSLRLDDIDWRGKIIHIHQLKTENHLRLPLTDAVAEALIDYLKKFRSGIPCREVFLSRKAPRGRMKTNAVTATLNKEVQLSGLNIKFQGAHSLRHSFAIHLLRQGVSMKTIGDILGHRSEESTCIYLRMATEDLRVVALEVPAPQMNNKEPFLFDFSKNNKMRTKGPSRVGPFRSLFKSDIESYLRLQHSLGKGFRREESVLHNLDFFLSSRYPSAKDFDNRHFEKWCKTFSKHVSTERRNRMRTVRNFCLYRQRMHPDTFIPDILTFPMNSPTPPPFILYPNDITRILNAIEEYPFRPAKYPLLRVNMRFMVIMLFTTGLRCGELIRLTLADFDPNEKTLFIRATKFHKQRIVPLSATTMQEIQAYILRCKEAGRNMKQSLPLFRNSMPPKLCRYNGSGMLQLWHKLCIASGIRTEKGSPPRLHDLRHSFAVNALLRWYEQGSDLRSKLPHLSTYMGHISIMSTHRYLPFVEPLRSAANAKFERKYGDLIWQLNEKE